MAHKYRVTFTWDVEADDPHEARDKALDGHDDGVIVSSTAELIGEGRPMCACEVDLPQYCTPDHPPYVTR